MHCFIFLMMAFFFVVLRGFAAAQDPAQKQEAKQIPPMIAQVLKGSADDFFKRFDKNQDGLVSKDELPPGLAKAFDRFDANGDGQLNKEEVERMLQVLRQRFGNNDNKKPNQNPNKNPNKIPPKNNPQVERMLERLLDQMDANKDGKISKAEAKGRIVDLFDRLDMNKDGYLDKEELRREAARFVANQGAPGGRGGPGPGFPRRGPEFDDLDKNADGRLTADELKGSSFANHFNDIDTNKDGKVDRKEFEAYLKKQAAQDADKPTADSKPAKKPEKK